MPDRICIVASGPSLRDITPDEISSASVHVIAVNGAGDWLPRYDQWFTLDPSSENVRRATIRRVRAEYVMALPFGYRGAPDGVRFMKRVEGVKFDRARAPGGLSTNPNEIYTGNSAFGALNLAFHFRPSRIVLLGVDGSQEARITGGSPRTLAHLPALFASAVLQLERAGVKIVNGSPASAVTCFPRMTPREALEWLTH